MKVKHLARFLLCVALYYSGLVAWARYLRKRNGQPRVVILAYQSFTDSCNYLGMSIPRHLFFQQVAALRSSFEFKTLGALLNSMQWRPTLKDTAVITVDDGYADSYEPLQELASDHGIPSSVFLTTNYIDQQRPTTVMALIFAIHHARTDFVDLCDLELGLGRYPIKTHADKETAIRAINTTLRTLPPDRQRATVDAVTHRCEVAAEMKVWAKTAMLTWQQAREMLETGIEIGAHSRSNAVLSRLHPEAVLVEIRGSVRRVREKIGCGVVTFAYPFESSGDVDAVVIDTCRKSGVSGAVTLSEHEMEGCDRFALPRIRVTPERCTSPWGSFSPAVWACEVEGLTQHLPARIARGVVDQWLASLTRIKKLAQRLYRFRIGLSY